MKEHEEQTTKVENNKIESNEKSLDGKLELFKKPTDIKEENERYKKF